jgi:hypothetical protein
MRDRRGIARVIERHRVRARPPSLKVMPHDTKGDSGVGRSGFAALRLRVGCSVFSVGL